MDPNANLKEMLELARELIDVEDGIDTDDLVDVGRLAELIIDLHSWIENGGFLPSAWQPKTGAEVVGVLRVDLCKCLEDCNLLSLYQGNHKLAKDTELLDRFGFSYIKAGDEFIIGIKKVGEPAPVPKSQPIPGPTVANFNQLLRAVENDNVVLMAAYDTKTQRPVSLICAAAGDKEIQFTPYAMMLNEHEIAWDRFLPPGDNGEFAKK